MKAAVLYGQNDIRYDDYPMPELRPGHVMVRVRACGICGSDIPRVLGTAAHFYPVVLGHEFSGEIARIGEGVEGLQVGDRVVGAPLVPCYRCPDCQQGHFSLCKHYTFIGSRIQGAFAQYVAIPAANAVKIAPESAFEEAALFEPASVALHGLLQAGFQGGGSVAVVGAGTIGIFAAQWAQLLGAARVVLYDVDDERLRIAGDMTGCEGVNSLTHDAAQAAKAHTGGRGFDAVFGVSGAPQSFVTAFQIAANKAKICFIGTPTSDVKFTASEWEQMNRHEFTVTGSWMSYSAPFPGKEWQLCADYLACGRLKCDRRMIHQAFPLSQCREAFACYAHPERVKGRILLVNE